MQRVAYEARCEHLVDGYFLAEHGDGIVHAVAAVFHDDFGEVLLCESGFSQETLRAQREVRRCGSEAAGFAPRLEERRPDDALGHLLHTEYERAVVLPG